MTQSDVRAAWPHWAVVEGENHHVVEMTRPRWWRYFTTMPRDFTCDGTKHTLPKWGNPTHVEFKVGTSNATLTRTYLRRALTGEEFASLFAGSNAMAESMAWVYELVIGDEHRGTWTASSEFGEIVWRFSRRTESEISSASA